MNQIIENVDKLTLLSVLVTDFLAFSGFCLLGLLVYKVIRKKQNKN